VRLSVILLLIISGNAMAQSGSSSLNLAIPQAGGSYQSDRIRTGNTECQMAIGSATRVEFGVVGILNQNDPYNNSSLINNPNFTPDMYRNNDFVRDVGVYARITIPIGAPRERLDCAQLYKIELEKQKLELFKLKQEIQQLRQLQFEN
jgi:hypothetical protein